jgi:uncharacterized membrane protein
LIVAASIEEYVPQFAPRARVARRAVSVWLLLVGVVLGYVGLICAAPLLRARGYAVASALLYSVFAPLCHQQPERSFYLAGYPLAVCARCFGIYAGGALCLLLYPLVRSLADATSVPARAWLVVAALPTAVDFTLGITGLWPNTHLSRALTGAWLGAGLVCFVLPGLLALGRSHRPHLSVPANGARER